jgi:hypothetical protein
MLEEAVWIRGAALVTSTDCVSDPTASEICKIERLPGEQDDSVPLLRLKAGSAYLQLVGADGQVWKDKDAVLVGHFGAADGGGGVGCDHGGAVDDGLA